MHAKGLVKLLEECGELSQVAAKKIAYPDTDEHPDGSSLSLRLEQEIADVLAAIDYVTRAYGLSEVSINARKSNKCLLCRTSACYMDDGVMNDPNYLCSRNCQYASGIHIH